MNNAEAKHLKETIAMVENSERQAAADLRALLGEVVIPGLLGKVTAGKKLEVTLQFTDTVDNRVALARAGKRVSLHFIEGDNGDDGDPNQLEIPT